MLKYFDVVPIMVDGQQITYENLRVHNISFIVTTHFMIDNASVLVGLNKKFAKLLILVPSCTYGK